MSQEEVILDLIKLSCFPEQSNITNLDASIDWESVYKVVQQHSVQWIGCAAFKHDIGIPNEIKGQWKKEIYQHICYNYRIIHIEQDVLKALNIASIPVVVLKGTSAAQYYPNPEFRLSGDIDLLTRPEHFAQACSIIEGLGGINTTSKQEEQRGRHRSYRIQGILIELHRTFSVLPDTSVASWLDEQLYKDIHQGSFYLSSNLNGIVLLEHIYQHLEDGIGLRQIIDWMLYVHHCLQDDQWHASFQGLANTCGMETFAKTLTKMCQLYMGLNCERITWCDMAEIKICTQLMGYILQSGNFGNRRGFLQTNDITQYPSLKKPLLLIRYLQSRGKTNWPIFAKHRLLSPFAWIAQGIHSVQRLSQNNADIKALHEAYQEGIFRKQLFHAMGIMQRKK